MDVYFGGSIRGGREDQEVYAELIDHLNDQGYNVLTEHVADPRLEVEGEKLTDPAIHDRDIAWLSQADAAVFEVSNPSHGVGYEARFAAASDTPTIGLAYADTRVSAMIHGAPGIATFSYTDVEDAERVLDTTLTARAVSSDGMQEYLDTVYEEEVKDLTIHMPSDTPFIFPFSSGERVDIPMQPRFQGNGFGYFITLGEDHPADVRAPSWNNKTWEYESSLSDALLYGNIATQNDAAAYLLGITDIEGKQSEDRFGLFITGGGEPSQLIDPQPQSNTPVTYQVTGIDEDGRFLSPNGAQPLLQLAADREKERKAAQPEPLSHIGAI